MRHIYAFTRSMGVCLALCMCQGAVHAASSVAGRVLPPQAGRSYTLKFNRPLKIYRKFHLANPSRLVLDINHKPVALTANKTQLPPVLRIRSAQHTAHQWRLVFALAKSADVAAARFKCAASGLICSLQIPCMTGSKHLTQNNSLSAHTAVSASHRQRNKNVIVVVDAGHGGIDPGATGRGHTHEKAVVLKIARDMAADLDRVPGFHAVLTRNADYYLKLRQRLAIARHYHADMFIAVHADAYINSQAHGVSVFALSGRGATSEAARWLAARENQSESLGGVTLSNKSAMLRSVLINLSQNATIASSINIGKKILQQVKPLAHLHQKHVEQAAFVVLKSPDIPSLLIEVGFLSNPHEEQRLKKLSHQQDMAQATVSGIVDYFQQHPPPGTYIYRRL